MDTTRPSASGSSATDVDLPSGTVVGEYRIEGRLAAGGMGTVYAAVHPIIGKRAAIKVLRAEHSRDEALIKRFVDEARAVNHIGHEHIVDIFSFGALEDGRSYFVMEWLEGESLKGAIQRRQIPFFEACNILDELCSALHAAHEKGIVHRDLKPDNVFLEVRGDRVSAKLLDFGIAKLAGGPRGTKGSDSETSPETVMGTPDYIAPEQAMGQPTTGSADVYSLGVMMFELFVGERPFSGNSSIEVIVKHVNEDPPDPRSLTPTIPPALSALLLRLLSKEPEARPTVAQVQSELRDLARAARLSGAIRPRGSAGLGRPVLLRRSEDLSALVRILLAELSAPACWVDATERGPPVGTPIRLRFEVPHLDLQLDFDGVLGGVFGSSGERVLVRYDRIPKESLDQVVEMTGGPTRAGEPSLRGTWLESGAASQVGVWSRYLGLDAAAVAPDAELGQDPTWSPAPSSGAPEELTAEALAPSSMGPLEVAPTRPWLGLGARILALTVAMAVAAVVSVSWVALRQTRIDRRFYVQDQNLTAARSVAAALERQGQVWRKQLELTLARNTYEGPAGEFERLAVCRTDGCRPVFGSPFDVDRVRSARSRIGPEGFDFWTDGTRLWTAAGGPDRWALAEVPRERLTDLARVARNVDVGVVAPGGQLVTRAGPPALPDLTGHPLLADALAPATPSGARSYGEDRSTVLGAWARAGAEAGRMAVVALSPESVTRAQIQVLSRQVGIVATSVLAVSAILALLLSSTTTRRLRKLAQQARQVAQGDFTKTASVRGNDEVRELASYFSRMTEALRERDDQVLASQRAMAADEASRIRKDLSSWLEQDLASRIQAIQQQLEGEPTAERTERLRNLAQQASNSLQSALLFAARRSNRVDLASCAREACESVERVPVTFSAPNAVLLPWVEADESKVRELLLLTLSGLAQAASGPLEAQLSQKADRELILRVRGPIPPSATGPLVERAAPVAAEQGVRLRHGPTPEGGSAVVLEFGTA